MRAEVPRGKDASTPARAGPTGKRCGPSRREGLLQAQRQVPRAHLPPLALSRSPGPGLPSVFWGYPVAFPKLSFRVLRCRRLPTADSRGEGRAEKNHFFCPLLRARWAWRALWVLDPCAPGVSSPSEAQGVQERRAPQHVGCWGAGGSEAAWCGLQSQAREASRSQPSALSPQFPSLLLLSPPSGAFSSTRRKVGIVGADRALSALALASLVSIPRTRRPYPGCSTSAAGHPPHTPNLSPVTCHPSGPRRPNSCMRSPESPSRYLQVQG